MTVQHNAFKVHNGLNFMNGLKRSKPSLVMFFLRNIQKQWDQIRCLANLRNTLNSVFTRFYFARLFYAIFSKLRDFFLRNLSNLRFFLRGRIKRVKTELSVVYIRKWSRKLSTQLLCDNRLIDHLAKWVFFKTKENW